MFLAHIQFLRYECEWIFGFLLKMEQCEQGLIFLSYFTVGCLHLQDLIMLLQYMPSVTFLFLVEAHMPPVSMICMCLICKL